MLRTRHTHSSKRYLTDGKPLQHVLVLFWPIGCRYAMTDAPLSPAAADDIADALAFALRFEGRKRKHDAGALMAAIVARHRVEHLDRAGFVVMKRSATVGASALGRGYEGR